MIAEREIRIVNEHDVVLARALAQIERDRSYVADHASSAAHWAVMKGLDRGRADALLAVGRLMAEVPEAEQQIRAGELTPQTAAVVGRVVPPTPRLEPNQPVAPEVQAAEEQATQQRARLFLERAKEKSQGRLKREVAAEKERIKQGDAVVPLFFHVKERVRDEWRLARKIASRRAGAHLSEGQAFTFVVADYVKRHDKENLSGRKKPLPRRAAPTSERPDSRSVPAQVRRAVVARAKGHCEFAGCPEGTFLQLCHVRPHAKGGDREVDNFAYLCTPHHTDFDLGSLAFFERGEAGVTFVDTRTGELFTPSPETDAADVLPANADVGADADAEQPARSSISENGLCSVHARWVCLRGGRSRLSGDPTAHP